ncbi:MAG: ATP-dependent metallopeptidase FtsH/Yme1/Tma family protein [Lentisphaerae bacterium]|nr:ATP-dependent metallopeptidase FtsH/Yme1/Tma family protein [Lentisphaerota bacterium]
MADENDHDKPNRPRGGPPRPDASAGRQPMRMLFFWLLVLFAAPTLILLYRASHDQDVERLPWHEFERYLLDDRVQDAVVVEDPSSGYTIKTIRGSYWPPNVDVSDDKALVKYRVEVVLTDSLLDLLRDHTEYSAERNSNMVGSILLSLLPILILVALIYFLFSRQLKAAGRGALQFGKSRARMINPSQERVTLKDVSGITEAKEEMQEIIEYLRDPARFQKLGGRIPKGVLMVGPPGTGKTLLARAIAGEADVPFFSISGSDFVEMFVGVGASRVRDMFEEGKRHAPCLVFIDEIDAVGRSRFSGIGGGHDEREQTLNALLVEMDGFETNSGIIVIAATNRPDVLDPALLRPGRFDRQIRIDLPDVNGRLGILRLHAKKIKMATGVDLGVIARGTPGFSGADLANLINEAALLAARNGKEAVELGDLEEARDKVAWGKERRSRKIDEKDRLVTAYHEAGHALVGIYSKHGTPLHKITIIPRGVAYLGATMHLPEQDRYTHSRSELMDELAMLMGGRVAEKLIFGEVTSGAAADIRQATDIARRMVCQWGMSEKMGPLSYSGRDEPVFLGRDIVRNEDYSPETAREIDIEVRQIIDATVHTVTALLSAHREQLERLAKKLLEVETLSAQQVYDLLGLELPVPQALADAVPDGPSAAAAADDEAAATADAEAAADGTAPSAAAAAEAGADNAGTAGPGTPTP